MRLSCFTLDKETRMAAGSEVVLLNMPREQSYGNHFGGGTAWDLEENILLAIKAWGRQDLFGNGSKLILPMVNQKIQFVLSKR